MRRLGASWNRSIIIPFGRKAVATLQETISERPPGKTAPSARDALQWPQTRRFASTRGIPFLRTLDAFRVGR